MHWPEGKVPRHLPDFETQARRARFRLLGLACRHFRISELLLAHHRDDQAETVLMRIVAKYHNLGLRGIRAEAGIPECQGLYGVHEGGAGCYGADAGTAADLLKRPGRHFPPIAGIGIATGGIRVLRPFLSHTKAELLATCLAADVKWVEDQTNKDKTLTTRNTIRHFLQTDVLPPALRSDGLLKLAKTINDNNEERGSNVKAHVNQLRINSLNVQTGRMQVMLPLPAAYHGAQASEEDTPQIHQDRQMIGHLRKIMEVVAPRSGVTSEQAATVFDHTFPPSKGRRYDSFNVAHVWWRHQQGEKVDASGHPPLPKVVRGDPPLYYHKWTLSRTPYRSDKPGPRCLWTPVATPNPAFPIPYEPQPFGTWQLFDGRWWLRVSSTVDELIVARPLDTLALSRFRETLPESFLRHFERMLKDNAPEKIRWTLPMLETTQSDALVLPTLGVWLGQAKKMLSWHVQYRSVDLDLLESIQTLQQ